jgi:hypothetical protein
MATTLQIQLVMAKVNALREYITSPPPPLQMERGVCSLPVRGGLGWGLSALLPSILDKAFKGDL